MIIISTWERKEGAKTEEGNTFLPPEKHRDEQERPQILGLDRSAEGASWIVLSKDE